MKSLKLRLLDEADEIRDLSNIARKYANGGAWSMAAAMFHAIDRRAKVAQAAAEHDGDTVRVNPMKRNPVTPNRKDIKFFLGGMSENDYFIKKTGAGKYRIFSDRQKHINRIAIALDGYFKVTYPPSAGDGQWIDVSSKSASNPRRKKYRVRKNFKKHAKRVKISRRRRSKR